MVRPRKNQQINIPSRAIEETIRLLDSKDASAITLSEIASAIGCRAPALYTHFSNKDALLRAVHDEGFRIMLDDKLALSAQQATDPFLRLRDEGYAYLQFAFEHPGLYRLMFSPPPYASSESLPPSSRHNDLGEHCLTILQATVNACQAAGFLSGMNAQQIAFTLWSTVHGAAALSLEGRSPNQYSGNTTATAMRTVDTLMAFILSTYLPEKPHLR